MDGNIWLMLMSVWFAICYFAIGYGLLRKDDYMNNQFAKMMEGISILAWLTFWSLWFVWPVKVLWNLSKKMVKR